MLITFALAAALASTERLPHDAASDAVGREHMFARAARDKGVAAAFTEFMDEDAIRLTPEPKPAAPYWKARPNKLGPPYLEWRPAWAVGSRCGHLAFTLGPYRYGDRSGGYYFTVWGNRGSDVPMKWRLDAGVELGRPQSLDFDVVSAAIPATGRWRAAHVDTYEMQIARRDQALNAALAQGPSAYAAVLAPEAKALGPAPLGPADGRDGVLARLAVRPSLAASHRGEIADSCGDLAISYGVADWSDAGKPVMGYYVRAWRRAGERWMLLFEEVAAAN